jgi:hypothetical protein
MQQKWPMFAMGAMAGAIAVLTLALVHQPAMSSACAQINPTGDPSNPTGDPVNPGGHPTAPGGGTGGRGVSAAIFGRGMGDTDMHLYAVPGMSSPGNQDSLWIVHKGALRPPGDPKNPPPSPPVDGKLTLALYKIDRGGSTIKLVDVRDISFDLGMVQFEDDQKPSVKEIAEKWKKANKGP